MKRSSRPRREHAGVRRWLSEPPGADVKRALARLERTDDLLALAVMPDVHVAGRVCNGVALATRELVYPEAVGADIGCGMTAAAFDCDADWLTREPAARAILAKLRTIAPVLRHRSLRDAPTHTSAPPPEQLSASRLVSAARREGRIELGTLGRGNHFLEFQADADNRLWIMLHSGSRAMGQIITQRHLKNGVRTRGGLLSLEARSLAGQDYLADVAWAVAYARASRRLMIERVGELLRARFGVRLVERSFVDCTHNTVDAERHFGERLWVHRKGANAAALGEPGLIPGSMGTRSFHVEGRGCAESLRSSSHGAGRALTRVQARRRIRAESLREQLADVWIDERIAASLCEEAPAAYKDIDAVMRAQKRLVRIVRRLRPVLCYKGV